LAAARGSRYEAIIVLGATCALRIGEVLSLRYEDLDLAAGTIKVQRTLWRGKVYPPKTNSSRRTIKLPAIALDALRRHTENNGSAEGWLFQTCNGKPIAAHHFHKCGWRPTLKKASLPKTLNYHRLRHGAIGLLLSEGVPVPVVTRYGGWSNPATLMRVYAHCIPGQENVAASAIDNVLS